MSEPLVSIGIPLHNAEQYLPVALPCLLSQDYRNIEYIISDNGSSDKTWEICRHYAAQDARILLRRNVGDIGPRRNFAQVLDAARGEFFMWAAHDDLWDKNFVRTLLAPLAAAEQRWLSCPRVIKVTPERAPISEHCFPLPEAADRLERIQAQMAASQSAWIYGLFRTVHVRRIFGRLAETSLVWGADHVILLGCFLADAVTGSNATTFYQMKTGMTAKIYKPQSFRAHVSYLAQLLPAVFQELARSPLPFREKAVLAPIVAYYLERQILHWLDSTLARAMIRIVRPVYRVARRTGT